MGFYFNIGIPAGLEISGRPVRLHFFKFYYIILSEIRHSKNQYQEEK